MLIEDDLFLDLRSHGLAVLDFVLHPLVLFEVIVELAFEFGHIGLLDLGGGVDWAHGLKRYLGEGTAIAGFINVMIEYAHLATIRKVGFDFALD